jgi:hypothetical protein
MTNNLVTELEESGAEVRSEQRQHVVGIGIAAEHLLGEDELPVDVHVEDAAASRHELDDAQVGGELFENPCRQTDGIRQGASGNAVFDANGSTLGHDASYRGVSRRGQRRMRRPACRSSSPISTNAYRTA